MVLWTFHTLEWALKARDLDDKMKMILNFFRNSYFVTELRFIVTFAKFLHNTYMKNYFLLKFLSLLHFVNDDLTIYSRFISDKFSKWFFLIFKSDNEGQIVKLVFGLSKLTLKLKVPLQFIVGIIFNFPNNQFLLIVY